MAQKNVYTLNSLFYMSRVYTFFWATLYITTEDSSPLECDAVSLKRGYQCFEGSQCFQLQGQAVQAE
jgi:hypothetical protein